MQLRRLVVLALATPLIVPAVAGAQSCAYAASAAAHQPREEADRDAQLFIESARRFSTDFDRCRALGFAIARARSVTSANLLFSAAAGVRGEFELAEILVAATQRGLLEARTAPAFFAAAGKIDSDFHLRRVLAAALRSGSTSPAIISQVLRAATAIEQDYELASLLVDVAGAAPLTNDLRDLYLAAARSLQNEWEHRRAM